MTENHKPTVVVGNGPAGLAALGAGPKDACMVAPTKTPSPGVCGGVLTPPACKFLRRRELLESIRSEGARNLNQIRVISSGRVLVNRNSNQGTLLCWDRTRMDRFLQDHLVHHEHPLRVGYVREVEIHDDGVELCLRGGSSVFAAGVIDATGHRRLMTSAVSSGHAGSDSSLVGMEWRVPVEDPPHPRLDLVLFPGGYAGVAPAKPRELIVSTVTELDRFQSVGPAEIWGSLVTQTKERLPLPENMPAGPRTKAGFWNVPDQTVHPRWVAVGDAAGFTMPLSGEGIFNALRQGYITGEFLHRREKNRPIWPLGEESRRLLRRQLMDPFDNQLWRWRAAHWAGMHHGLISVIDSVAPALNRWLFEICFPRPVKWDR